jgi:glycerol-3-phosphate O-acyltransferase
VVVPTVVVPTVVVPTVVVPTAVVLTAVVVVAAATAAPVVPTALVLAAAVLAVVALTVAALIATVVPAVAAAQDQPHCCELEAPAESAELVRVFAHGMCSSCQTLCYYHVNEHRQFKRSELQHLVPRGRQAQ